jgi:hypothetical protein
VKGKGAERSKEEQEQRTADATAINLNSKISGHGLNPDEIKATKISPRGNKGNNDFIGQVGQADSHG